MKSSVLFSLIIITATCSAKAAEAPKPTEPPVSHFQGTCEGDPDGRKFAEKACYTNYYPGDAGFGDRYRPPTCDKKHRVSEKQKEMLAKAYARAPDYVRAKLCRLTQLFVTKPTPGGPSGWGFWEGSDRPPGKGVYLAIADRDLTSKKSVADVENETVQRLLGISDRGRRSRQRLLRLRSAEPSEPELTVLGELAHELGHVLLADANADGVYANHPRRQVSGPPKSTCFQDAFLNASWEPDSFRKDMRRWVAFGEQYQNKAKNPDAAFDLRRLKLAVRRGKLDAANDAIGGVLRSEEFVSTLARSNADEDFVETYKYKVLADAAPKLTIGIRLGGRDINTLRLLDSGALAKKVSCLRDLGLLSGTP
jgi:hypothetical protein